MSDVNENLDGTKEFLDMGMVMGNDLVVCPVWCEPTLVKRIKCDSDGVLVNSSVMSDLLQISTHGATRSTFYVSTKHNVSILG